MTDATSNVNGIPLAITIGIITTIITMDTRKEHPLLEPIAHPVVPMPRAGYSWKIVATTITTVPIDHETTVHHQSSVHVKTTLRPVSTGMLVDQNLAKNAAVPVIEIELMIWATGSGAQARPLIARTMLLVAGRNPTHCESPVVAKGTIIDQGEPVTTNKVLQDKALSREMEEFARENPVIPHH